MNERYQVQVISTDQWAIQQAIATSVMNGWTEYVDLKMLSPSVDSMGYPVMQMAVLIMQKPYIMAKE